MITKEQFENINSIIDKNNLAIKEDYQNLKKQITEILDYSLQKLCIIYPIIQEPKIVEINNYSLNTSYENDAAITFFAIIKIIKDNVNLNYLIKSKKKRKSKREQLMEQMMSSMQKDIPYIDDLSKNIKDNFINYITANDRIFDRNGTIRIIIDNQFIVDIIVSYEFIENQIDYFKLTKWQNFNYVDFKENFNKKELNTNAQFSKMCRIYKSLEKELIYADISNIYISKQENLTESLLYNVPNEYFSLEDKDCFLKTCSYLINTDFKNFKSVDEKFNLFNKKSNNFDIKTAKNYVRKVMYVYNNFDEICTTSASIVNQNENFNNELQRQKQNIEIKKFNKISLKKKDR